MTKKTRKRAPKQLTRKQRSRVEREQNIERILIWSIAAVALLVVGVLAYGFIVENVVKAREAVAVVGETPIRTNDFQGLVRFTRMQMNAELQGMYQQQQALDPTDQSVQFYLEYLQSNIRDLQEQLAAENGLVIGEQALDQLIQNEIVRQEAERRGISVSSDELEQALEKYFGYERNPATPTPIPSSTPPLTQTSDVTPEPTMTPLPTATPVTEQEFRRRYEEFLRSLKAQNISDQQFRTWFKATLLFDKVYEQIVAEAPTAAEQVKIRYLMVGSEEQADELVVRLDAGEDFEALIDELEADESEGMRYGAELDWFPQSVIEQYMGEQVAELAFSLAPGEYSPSVVQQEGSSYVIIQVVSREVRALDESVRQQLGDQAFQEWLQAQEELLVERKTYRDRVPVTP